MCYIKNVSRHLKPENSSAVASNYVPGAVQLKERAIYGQVEQLMGDTELFCEATYQNTHKEALLPRGLVTAPR